MRFIVVLLSLVFFQACSSSKKTLLQKEVKEEKKLIDAVSIFRKNNADLALKKLLSIDANNYNNAYEVYNYIGVIYYQKNKLNKAEVYFKKSISALFDFEDSHNNLGYIYLLKERYDLAREEFSTSLRINPNYETAKKNLGLLKDLESSEISYSTVEMFQDAFEQENVDKKIKAYERLSELKPELLEIKNNLAVAYYQKGKAGQAKTLLKQVLSNNPKYYEAHNNLAYIYFKEKNYNIATRHFLTSIRLRATYTTALLNLGDLFYEKKDYVNSKKVWLKILSVEPENRYVEKRLKKINEMGI